MIVIDQEVLEALPYLKYPFAVHLQDTLEYKI